MIKWSFNKLSEEGDDSILKYYCDIQYALHVNSFIGEDDKEKKGHRQRVLRVREFGPR